MKKVLLILSVFLATVCSANVLANNIGTVNMQTVFRSSPQVRKANAALQKKFASRKNSIISMGKVLQSKVAKFQKNQSVMNARNLQSLRSTIRAMGLKLRKAQARFQKDLMAAQNKQMQTFMASVKAVVKKVAAQKKLDVVFPSNSVLYSNTDLDITSSVLADLKK